MVSNITEQAKIHLTPAALLGIGVLSLLFSVLAVWGGYQLGVYSVEPAIQEDQTVVALQDLFDLERQKLGDLQKTTDENLNAIALRMGQLQARVLRLDALGERLSQMAQLDESEFDFGTIPPQGGPDSTAAGGQTEIGSLIADLEMLTATLSDRKQKLSYIEDLIMNRNLQKEVSPTGQPIKKGWISSYFGVRKDPFTGKKVMHKGVDFAGKFGSDVVAVASGIVTYASKKPGYGYLVEIHHGKGYATRYAHNAEILVQVGDRVGQGQTIGKMGSSGRSTGPHVHFEVLRNGTSINPSKYISASR